MTGAKAESGSTGSILEEPNTSNMSDDSGDSGGTFSLRRAVAAFESKVAKLEELVLIRGPPGPQAAELSAIDQAVTVLEQQLHAVKVHIRNETAMLAKSRALVELSSNQQKKLQYITEHLPSRLPGIDLQVNEISSRVANMPTDMGSAPLSTPARKLVEKKGRGPPPRWYVTVDELASISSYMRGRLTLDKVNAAVDEMAGFAESNARLLAAPRNKLGDEALEKVLELRDIASLEDVKGRYFFLETDMRGPLLKLDNTGKSIITILRHLGRILEVRSGRQRAYAILKT